MDPLYISPTKKKGKKEKKVNHKTTQCTKKKGMLFQFYFISSALPKAQLGGH